MITSGEEICSETLHARSWWIRIFDVGVVVHELGHYVGALIVEAKNIRVMLIDKHGNGWLAHGQISPAKAFIVALMPFLISNALALTLFADAIRAYNAYNFPYFIFTLWLGISISLYSHPSGPDLILALRNYAQAWRQATLLYKIVILLLSPFIITLMAAMLVKHRFFEGSINSWLWVAVTLAVANAYVAALG